MTTRRDFQLSTFIKKLARPILLPPLRKIGWKPRPFVRVPRISVKDRLREGDVPTRVSVRDDQTILLNGSPFFPVGLYYARCEIEDETGAGLRRLRAMGFNTIFFDGGLESESLLDRIWRAGLYVCYRPPGEIYREYELLKQVVMKFARHPAVLFWEMDDEPVLNRLKLADVEIGCRIVRGIDPYHPILCNQWLSSLEQEGEMRAWARLADIYGFSFYQVPLWRWRERLSLVEAGWPHSIAAVGKQTDIWKSYAPGKPIIPVLQAWAWNCLEDGEAAYPTYQECRFMAYQAVIHGAKGLHHYGAVTASRVNFACGIPPNIHADLDQTHADFLRAQGYNRWFWSYYAKVIEELSRMSAVFASCDTDWVPEVRDLAPDPPRGCRLEYRVKRHLGSAVILLVNPSDSSLPAEICAPSLRGRALKLWGQGTSIQVNSDGHFRDVLEPYGVRIYSDRPDLLEGISDSYNSGDEYDSCSGHAAEEAAGHQVEADREGRNPA